jgi:hypothetical protein
MGGSDRTYTTYGTNGWSLFANHMGLIRGRRRVVSSASS